MELGITFEDEDLGLMRDRSSVPRLKSFNAKVCQPLWFETEADLNDPQVSEVNSQLLKFNADYQYRHENYEAALDFYKKSLAVLPSHSAATRLDINHSVTRCHLRMGRVNEAHSIAQMLTETAQNSDQSRQSRILSLEVAMAMENWKDCQSYLHLLISQQPLLTQFWLQLADICQKGEPPGEERLDVILITCYIRVRLLIENYISSVSEVVRERDQKILQQVETKLGELGATEDIVERASEYLRFDLKQVRGQECDKDVQSSEVTDTDQSTQLPGDVAACFYSKWCGWAKSVSITIFKMS